MAETLQNMVGYQLGITPGAATVPTTTMIVQWLKDGSIYIMKHAPLDAIAEKHVSAAANLTAGVLLGEVALPGDYLRFVNWFNTTTGESVQFVEIGYLYLVRNAGEFDTQILCVSIEDGKLKGNSALAGTLIGNLIYVKEPVDSADVPTKLHDLVVLYAVARAKAEAQEMDEFQALMGELEGKIAKLGES